MAENVKSIFVIMPFRETPTRTRDDLDTFFNFNLKKRIEEEKSFKYKYIVNRSGDAFGITEQIIKDLYTSDIVICDLSGKNANPNVMFELGIRLSLSNKPVILIREEHESNETIFDIHGYFTQPYNPHQYHTLEEHIINKIKSFESNSEIFQSPVLRTLSVEPSVSFEIRRINAHQRSRMLLFNLLNFVEQLHMETDAFLKKYEKDKFSFKNTIELVNTLSENMDKLVGLPWNEFPEITTSLPSLGSILIDFPLSGYISNNIELQLIQTFSKYYYFASNFSRSQKFSKIELIYILIHDGLFLEQIVQGMLFILSNPAETKKITEALSKAYDKIILKFDINKDLRIVEIDKELFIRR